MFEELSKKNPRFAYIFDDAEDSIKSISEPHKSRIIKAFQAVAEIANERLSEYKSADAVMDDSASDLTALTGIDVRIDGIEKALARAVGRQDTARAILDAIRYEIGKFRKSGDVDE
jgi:hypothetical protein